MECSNVIYILVILSSIYSTVLCNRLRPNYQQDGNLVQRLQDVETKQQLADRKVARLEHIVHTQANIIKEQKSSMERLESFVRKEGSRTAHTFRMARQNRHKTSLIIKVLQQNKIDVERHVPGNHNKSGNHRAPGNHRAQPGNHRAQGNYHAQGNHRAPGNDHLQGNKHGLGDQNTQGKHHGHKGVNVDRPPFATGLHTGRQHNGKNTNGKTNNPVTSHGNKNQHHLSGPHNSGHNHDKTDSPSRHEHNTHPKQQQTQQDHEQKAAEVVSGEHRDEESTPQ